MQRTLLFTLFPLAQWLAPGSAIAAADRPKIPAICGDHLGWMNVAARFGKTIQGIRSPLLKMQQAS